jgi:GNAT superfamily N-acetyltransferase
VTVRHSFRFPFAQRPLEIAWLTPDDHAWIARQVENASQRHVHLDWQVLPEMLRSDAFRCRAAREDRAIRAAIGATVLQSPYYSQRVAWIRLILPGGNARRDPALDLAWETLRADLHAEGVTSVGMLMLDSWVEAPASRWGFAQTNSVVTLRRDSGPIPDAAEPPLRIREVSVTEMDSIAALDAMAFAPIWHHDRAALESASRQAATFTVLENGHDMLGYQLSTWHMDSGHLARLAVRPDRQGQGLGAALVGGMLRFFAERNVHTITVNTQADNTASRRLYGRLGFELSGHSVAFWSINLT